MCHEPARSPDRHGLFGTRRACGGGHEEGRHGADEVQAGGDDRRAGHRRGVDEQGGPGPGAVAGTSPPQTWPGQKFSRRFPRMGRFDYHETATTHCSRQASMMVTMRVFAGGGPVPEARRSRPTGSSHPPLARHPAPLTSARGLECGLDGKFLSFDGVCNAQVGKGSRQAQFSASFPDVKCLTPGASRS